MKNNPFMYVIFLWSNRVPLKSVLWRKWNFYENNYKVKFSLLFSVENREKNEGMN